MSQNIDWTTFINRIYPVGSIYMSTTHSTASAVAAALGGGTWSAWGTGRVPVGVNTGDTDFNSAEKTGGEKAHKLTNAEIPSHSHDIYSGYSDTSAGTDAYRYQYWAGASLGWHGGNLGTSSTGGGGSHNNLQPYITVYMWKRTA